MKNPMIEVQNVYLNDYILDLKNIMKISYYNNIDQIGYTLEMTYNDITDVKNKLPIKGGEKIKITFLDIYKTKVQKTFILREVKRINDPLQESAIIHFSAITEEAFYLGINRIYQSYNDTVSNIVKKIIPKVLDEKPTSDKYQILIPGFTGTKALKYLCQFTNNYYTFEYNKGFKFSSIENLLVPNDNIYKLQSNNRKDRYYIIDSKEVELFNTINEAYDNIYNNEYITYNPGTKSISTIKSDIKTEQGLIKTLGSGENFSESIMKEIEPRITTLPYFSNNLDYFKTSKISNLLFNKTFEILLNGDLDLQVGNTIHIQVKDNKLTTGLYLITKVAHHIDAKDYYTKLEIQKNAYYKGNITSNVIL